MTPAERAHYHIDGIRHRADSLPEPLRSELVALSVALKEMMACLPREELPDPYQNCPLEPIPDSWSDTLGKRWMDTQ